VYEQSLAFASPASLAGPGTLHKMLQTPKMSYGYVIERSSGIQKYQMEFVKNMNFKLLEMS
jgi:hypothetical protein